MRKDFVSSFFHCPSMLPMSWRAVTLVKRNLSVCRFPFSQQCHARRLLGVCYGIPGLLPAQEWRLGTLAQEWRLRTMASSLPTWQVHYQEKGPKGHRNQTDGDVDRILDHERERGGETLVQIFFPVIPYPNLHSTLEVVIRPSIPYIVGGISSHLAPRHPKVPMYSNPNSWSSALHLGLNEKFPPYSWHRPTDSSTFRAINCAAKSAGSVPAGAYQARLPHPHPVSYQLMMKSSAHWPSCNAGTSKSRQRRVRPQYSHHTTGSTLRRNSGMPTSGMDNCTLHTSPIPDPRLPWGLGLIFKACCSHLLWGWASYCVF